MPSPIAPSLTAPLTEFQQNLDAALRQDAAAETFVGVRAKGKRWLIPLDALEEVGLVQQVARLGTMPPAVVGLANFRGRPRTLVDTPRLLGQATPADQGGPWAMVLREADLGVALLWPEVLGLFSLSHFPDQKPSTHPLGVAMRRDAAGDAWEELNVDALLAHLREGSTKREAA